MHAKYFLLALTSLLLGGSVRAETIVRNDPIPPEFFGWVIHRAISTTAWPSTSFGTWRLWDSYIKWSDIEPNEGVFKFSDFDAQVALGLKNQMQLIYTLGQTPRWASSRPSEKHAWGLGAGGMPISIKSWENYTDAVVKRYAGKIYGYEIWNEPKYTDATGECRGAIFFCGNPQMLFDLTKSAAAVIRRVDPNAKISTPGFTDGLSGVERLGTYLATGASKYIDAVSFHFYSEKPEDIVSIVGAIRSKLTENGIPNLPIWGTEMGYLVQNDEASVVAENSKGGPFSRVYSSRQVAGLLARALVLQAATGVSRAVWYAWDDKRMGAISTRSGYPNALARGYAAVQYWLINSTIKCAVATSRDSWSCKLRREGRTATLTWNNAKLTFPTDTAEATDGRIVYIPSNLLAFDGGVEFVSDDGRPW